MAVVNQMRDFAEVGHLQIELTNAIFCQFLPGWGGYTGAPGGACCGYP